MAAGQTTTGESLESGSQIASQPAQLCLKTGFSNSKALPNACCMNSEGERGYDKKSIVRKRLNSAGLNIYRAFVRLCEAEHE